MKIWPYIFCVMLMHATHCMYSFSYDSAIYAAQKGNWQDAYAALNNIITNDPDDADVMYDAGVAAYNLNDHCQAATCFVRAAQCGANKDICFRSHFNAGNAYVDQKDLKSALEQYDKALAIDPDNEYARHNRDRVAQMLQEQEKQEQEKNEQNEQKNQQDDQKNDEKKDNNNEQRNENDQSGNDGNDSNDSQNQNQRGNDQQSSSNNDQQNGNQKNKQQQNQQQGNDGNDPQNALDEKSQGDQTDEAAERGKDTERKKHGDNQEQQKNASNEQKRDGKHELDKKANDAQGDGDKQQGNQHGQTPKEQQTTNDKDNVPFAGMQEQGIDDPWLVSILNNQEIQDKAINKQLMEAKIRQHGGKNGQNCW